MNRLKTGRFSLLIGASLLFCLPMAALAGHGGPRRPEPVALEIGMLIFFCLWAIAVKIAMVKDLLAKYLRKEKSGVFLIPVFLLTLVSFGSMAPLLLNVRKVDSITEAILVLLPATLFISACEAWTMQWLGGTVIRHHFEEVPSLKRLFLAFSCGNGVALLASIPVAFVMIATLVFLSW